MTGSLAEILLTSKSIVFFGGAGVSTESGIPDFRSEQGLYHAKAQYGHSPEELLSHDFLMRCPNVFFEYYMNNLIHQDARPNTAHTALAALERAGKLDAVITQNIDGLHQAAGAKAVYELHGSIHRNYCLDCKEAYSLAYILSAGAALPVCAKCRGAVRPDVVLYGEPLNHHTWMNAISAIQKADALIVGGTSLSVYPAAGLLHYYRGNRLCLINKTETPFDSSADLLIHDSIGAVLSAAVHAALQ